MALRQLGDWGVANIADSLTVINDQIADALEERWTPVPKKHRSPHLLGAVSGVYPKTLCKNFRLRTSISVVEDR